MNSTTTEKPLTEIIADLQAFATKHKIIFDDSGECGFGRECVGFRDGHNWIDHNPISMAGDYERISEFEDERLQPPDDVDAYHKHNCLAVLGRGESAIRQLHAWIRHIESQGEVEIADYETGATGMQALISGVVGRAIRLRPRKG